MSGRKDIGFSFYINLPEEIEATPEVKTIVNNFDYIGDIVSLTRLSGESNVDYRNRMWDVRVHPGGPEYEGVLNSLGRDLGMLRQETLIIDLKLDSAGSPIATNPRVDILANRVVLYSDWRPNDAGTIDREIRTYQLDDAGYYLNDLVTQINQSPYFSASIVAGIRPNLHSSTLVRGSSDIFVIDNYVRADKLVPLRYQNVMAETLSFTEKNIFDTEVASNPSADGEYTVDYVNGEILSYTLPSGGGSCSYHAGRFPMKVDSLPIQIFTLQDDDFTDELYEKETLDSGDEANALPNAEGSEIFHQLFMETKVFWGK